MNLPLPVSSVDCSSAAASATPAPRLHLLGVQKPELEQQILLAGQPSYRAAQVLEWTYRKHADDFTAMSNLPRTLREWLAQNAAIYTGQVARQSAASDGTRKLLIQFPDGKSVETVWIPSQRRNTACISSQVGCAVGCRFCASGIDGVERNLTAGEIVEQAMQISRLIAATEPAAADATPGPATATDRDTASRSSVAGPGERLSNIVLMGMGEPLANYRNVVAAIRILNAPWGMGVGARKITLSTVGLPKQMKNLADEQIQINLALSLHAPDDELRRQIIPWARGVSIADLMDACLYYFKRSGREVTLEYVLLAGTNDRPQHADALARIARKIRANINLLRYNPVPGLPYERPSAEAAFEFQARVRAGGANVHIRTSRGLDADAACGQLRRTVSQPLS